MTDQHQSADEPAPPPFGLSLRAIVGGGFTVVAAFLGLALSFTIASLEELAGQSERLLESGVVTTRLIEQLAERITEVERSARQYTVVPQPNFAQIYRDRRRALLETLQALEAREEGVSALAPALEDLKVRLQEIETFIGAASPPGDAAESFVAMNEIADRSREIAQNRFDEELRRLLAEVTVARTALTALTVAVVVAALLIALGFTWLVGRPMRQITNSIEALGRAELDTPVRVTGPRDLRSIGTSLDWLRRRIHDLETQKSTFVRHMSHELKSPLANIRAGIDLLREEAPEDPGLQEVAAIVDRNATRLQRQIDDLLQYAGWQDAHPPQKPVRISLDDLIKRSVLDQAFAARARGVEVRTDLDTVKLTAQEGQIQALVDNLIGNAIKYSPEGGAVDVRLTRLGASAIIEVEDQGPGIPADLREQVFEPFFRGPDAASTAGTGIGLSLALAATRAHGGSIRILDKQAGTHMEVVLPLES